MRFTCLLYLLLLCMSLFSGCQSAQDCRVEETLKFAGANRPELEKVLAHYADNPQKREAARFLIAAMKDWYGYDAPEIDSLKAAMRDNRLAETRPDSLRLARWKRVDYEKLPKVYDAQAVTAEYLIENIDLAFEAWHRYPWGKYYSFGDFCRYLLPYRVGDEKLENWRARYSGHFGHLLDSLYQGTDVMVAVDSLQHYLGRQRTYYESGFSGPHLGASFMLDYWTGECRNYTDFMLYVFRSVGIPIVKDTYFWSPDFRTSHTWNAVKDTTGLFVPVEFKSADNTRDWKAQAHTRRRSGKVYRLSEVRLDKPIFTGDYFKEDVTAEYYPANRVEIPGVADMERDGLIGLFSSGGWIPVGAYRVKGGRAWVENVEEGIIFQPLVVEDGRLRESGYPFVVREGKAVVFRPDESDCSVVTLSRKYPLTERMGNYLRWMSGTTLYGGNSPSGPWRRLAVVEDTTKTLEKFAKNTVGGTYRYAWLQARPRWQLQISELELYADTAFQEKLPYKVVDCSEPLYFMSEWRGVEKMSDGDRLTYYLTKEKEAWCILDLGRRERIGGMVVVPRNDDNFVHRGECYELFYQAGTEGWKSLGMKIAASGRIRFDRVPAGALLWLHDHTKGVEEQVFWMEDGRQKFLGGVDFQ